MTRGRRSDGIRTVADLKGRCRVDEITGCWQYVGCTTGDTPHPQLWVPAIGKHTTMGVAIAVLLTGKRPEPGVFWHCTCETRGCANPAHRRPGDRRAQMLAARMVRTPDQIARITAGKRAASELSDAAAEQIRLSDEPLRVVAERYGCSVSHAGNIRTGKRRRQLGVRAASVFNLGG